MIFGSQRDFNLFVGINRELLSDVIEQEILYYKMIVFDIRVHSPKKTPVTPPSAISSNCFFSFQNRIVWNEWGVHSAPNLRLDLHGLNHRICKTESAALLFENVKGMYHMLLL
jgi:hypothetical protein